MYNYGMSLCWSSSDGEKQESVDDMLELVKNI